MNGTTVAGGLELALGCDLIIAAEGAKSRRYARQLFLVSRRRRIGEARAARWRSQCQAADVLGRERVRRGSKGPGPCRYCRWRRSADRVDRRAGCETRRQEPAGAAAHESRNQPRQTNCPSGLLSNGSATSTNCTVIPMTGRKGFSHSRKSVHRVLPVDRSSSSYTAFFDAEPVQRIASGMIGWEWVLRRTYGKHPNCTPGT